jgi:hypothetical protein
MADAARRVPATLDGLPLFPLRLAARHLSADLDGLNDEGPREGWKRSRGECCDRRQLEHGNDGVRRNQGFDAGKKVMGRERHLLTDTLGLPLVFTVHSAGIQDRDGLPSLSTRSKGGPRGF